MKSDRRGKRKALLFVVIFATLAFITVGCASGTTPPEEAWNKTFGGADVDYARAVQQTTDGGYILAGSTELGGATYPVDFLLVKTDSNGSKEWDKTFGGYGSDLADSVQQTTDGGFILAGYTTSYGAGFLDAWLVKTDANGSKEWDKIFGDTHNDWVWSVQQTVDGGFILAGYTTLEKGTSLDDDFWLVKTDANGNREWEKTFGGTESSYARAVQQTADGGYILAGVTHSYGAGSGDVWLVKTDSNGIKEWDKTFGGTNYDDAWAIQQTAGGGFILAGHTDSYGAGFLDAWLVKTDSNGTEQWNKTFGGWLRDSAYSVQQTSDGSYILAGETESYGAGSFDAWLLKTDSNGTEQWGKTFGGTGFDRARAVQQTTDGGYILAGWTWSFGAGDSDFWLIKVKGEEPTISIFDTEPSENPYPSIMGAHEGTITPNKTIVVHKMYTYPCAGTGGHTEYVKFHGNGLNVNKTWNGYIDDYYNITFDPPITLETNTTYNYEIRTGSYPQIIHEQSLPTPNGTINCTQFTDANGKIYYDWIPAIKLE